jgi:hypothetical protein
MKKYSLLAGIIWFGFLCLQGPALANHDYWYKKYDRDNDARWNYDEYLAAQRQWEAQYHRHPMSEKQLREYYKKLDKNRDGYLSPEEARRGHGW